MAAPGKTSAALTGPQLDNRRVVAALIDLLPPLAGVALAYAAGLSLTPGLLLVGVGWTLYYFFALESGAGQTLGKRAMNLRVVSADGTPATMEQIAKRTVVRILDGHIVGLVVMLATGERRLRLGDIVAGTAVSEAQSAPAAAAAPPAPPSPPAAELEPAARPAAEPPAARPPFFKRSLSIPSLGRKQSASAGSATTPALSVAPSLSPDPLQPIRNGRPTDAVSADVPPQVKPFAPFEARRGDEPRLDAELDGPEPLVDLDRPEARDAAEEPDPLADLGGREPVVELDGPGGEHEPQHVREPLFERGCWAEWEVQAVTESPEPTPGSELGPAPEEYPAPEEEHGLTIKPIETVSPLDLLMQDADERRPGSD